MKIFDKILLKYLTIIFRNHILILILLASCSQILNFSLNVSSAEERWYYAKFEFRAVRGKNLGLPF